MVCDWVCKDRHDVFRNSTGLVLQAGKSIFEWYTNMLCVAMMKDQRPVELRNGLRSQVRSQLSGRPDPTPHVMLHGAVSDSVLHPCAATQPSPRRPTVAVELMCHAPSAPAPLGGRPPTALGRHLAIGVALFRRSDALLLHRDRPGSRSLMQH